MLHPVVAFKNQIAGRGGSLDVVLEPRLLEPEVSALPEVRQELSENEGSRAFVVSPLTVGPFSNEPVLNLATPAWSSGERGVLALSVRVRAIDRGGGRGSAPEISLADQTGQPEWILVETGLFGTRQSFAPIRGSRLDGEQLVVLAVSKDQVKDAPNIDPDARISESEEDALRQYYSA